MGMLTLLTMRPVTPIPFRIVTCREGEREGGREGEENTEEVKEVALELLKDGQRNSLPLFRHGTRETYIDNDRHGSIVHRLRAVRPEVGALCQVNVAGTQTEREEGI